MATYTVHSNSTSQHGQSERFPIIWKNTKLISRLIKGNPHALRGDTIIKSSTLKCEYPDGFVIEVGNKWTSVRFVQTEEFASKSNDPNGKDMEWCKTYVASIEKWTTRPNQWVAMPIITMATAEFFNIDSMQLFMKTIPPLLHRASNLR